MTLKETEYSDLLNEIVKRSEACDDPLIVMEMLKEIFRVHKKIPLYPGIVLMCLGKMIESAKPEDLREGDFVSLKTNGESVAGIIEKIDKDGMILKDCFKLKKEKSVKINKMEGAGVSRLDKKTLKKLWPSLVFDEE